MTGEEEIERRHFMDLMDEPYARLVELHQESCSTDVDYPGWTPEMGCCAADVIIKKRKADRREARKARRRPTQTELVLRWMVLSVVSTVGCAAIALNDFKNDNYWVAAIFTALTVSGLYGLRAYIRDLAKRIDGRG